MVVVAAINDFSWNGSKRTPMFVFVLVTRFHLPFAETNIRRLPLLPSHCPSVFHLFQLRKCCLIKEIGNPDDF